MGVEIKCSWLNREDKNVYYSRCSWKTVNRAAAKRGLSGKSDGKSKYGWLDL